METHEVTVTPTEIRDAWSVIQRGSTPFKRKHKGRLGNNLDCYRGDRVDPFIGASGTQIDHRLTHGYEVEQRSMALSGSSECNLPAPMWDEEEGDLVVSQVLSGEDMYLLRWDESPATRSLKIRACCGMSAGAESKVIGDYMEWVLKVMDAARAQGIFASLELYFAAGDPFVGKGGDNMTVTIPLVEPGEMVDVTSWRAFLTPGSFRSLGFVAMGLGAERLKQTLNSGYGYPRNQGWSVKYAESEATLTIECPTSAAAFDEDLMDRMLADAYSM